MSSFQVCILTQSIPSVAGSRRLTLKAAQGDQGGIQDEPECGSGFSSDFPDLGAHRSSFSLSSLQPPAQGSGLRRRDCLSVLRFFFP